MIRISFTKHKQFTYQTKRKHSAVCKSCRAELKERTSNFYVTSRESAEPGKITGTMQLHWESLFYKSLWLLTGASTDKKWK